LTKMLPFVPDDVAQLQVNDSKGFRRFCARCYQ